jgi:hypothetical protein
MPSESSRRWNDERTPALDEIEAAHESVGGSERGRRYATQQINYAYAAILSAQFQAFCRDLHSESIDYMVTVVPADLQDVLKVEFLMNRTLDRGNPHPGGIGSDFNRLGVDFWPEVYAIHGSNNRRRELLQELIEWRNAIAHQDFNPVGGNPTLHLGRVRSWRSAVNALTVFFDRVMRGYLGGLMGTAPLVREMERML